MNRQPGPGPRTRPVSGRCPRHWPRTVLPVLVTTLSLVGTAPPRTVAAQQEESVRLTVLIRDALNREALPGAVIELTGVVGRPVTGLDGRAVIEVPRGRYWVAARRWGYDRLAGNLDVIDSGEITVEMHRTRIVDPGAPGILVVRVVKGETGDPLEGALVSLPGGEGRVTDEHGLVEFVNMREQLVRFEVEATGFGDRAAPVALRPGRTTAVRVEMVDETADPRPIETEMRSIFMEARGNHDRMARNMKRTHVLTRPMLDQLAVAKLTDAFRTVPGIRVEGQIAEPPNLFRGQCPLSLYVDGTRRHTDLPGTRSFFIDDLSPASVELIEIWVSRRNPTCGGTVLIWTRG